jgi:NAD(P)H dehydrogenase (quinone)
MITVTGATGALNGATVDHLLERLPADQLVVVARDVAKAQRFAERGVQVRHGDYADLLVSSSDPAADGVALHRTAIEAAVTAGVGRVLYTSHQGAAPTTPFGPGRDHAATEQLLAESGLPWTSLRNGFYAHSLLFMTGSWRETGRIEVPADGPVSWTSREDEAEAAALVLLSDGGYDGPVTLTAGTAPTFADVAAIAAEVSGRPVERVLVDPDEWLAGQVAGGTPEFVARFLLGMYSAAEQGFFAGVDPLLGELLGREPRTVRDVLAAPAH